jgi:hypothetical protein
MTMSCCEVCLPIHGPGCAPSYRDERGRAICVFCADGVPCPKQLQILKQRRAHKGLEGEMNGSDKSKSIAVVSTPATSPAKRMCKVAGCAGELSYNNHTGYCHEHRGRARRAKSKANGHAATIHFPAGRGELAHGNGATASKPDRDRDGNSRKLEERVNLVLSGLPLDEKVRMISLWLRTA